MTTNATNTTDTTVTGTFTYDGWDEEELSRTADGTRLARASVRNTFTGAVEAAGTHCAYTIVYRPDGTGTFTGHQQFEGAVGGRRGSFVVRESGTFDERGTVQGSFEVMEGSGGGALAGLTGSGTFTAEHGVEAVPYRFDHTLPGPAAG
ncbi:DUF3224 domain-containing protein [Streptomyces caatingaensis]|uniref:DUF3224 domain-containing protein n=1 Tax=Streptomyces caatingaensis TaxID=1678637 RepID=A0A0K9XFP6_9ACTN|nr:DUF3224 domain-containing protein [Streptomyces caatingaensis]KNB52195.1 hypothetical protein AC230_11600 [Streptomyces caatingaensis]